ncbi:MAG: 30S ribosomal protein S21 [Candidatus Pacebacteria bacterium]|nr:30S ribosomal protein S21 [Candidatus Paceibacterota bacterium]
MTLEVQKKERETPQSLIRRFTKRVKQSGILIRKRKRRFYQRPLSAQAKKRALLRRKELEQEYEQKKKLGL